MKSVSFSDLRNSIGMNNFEQNLKKSSSIKQLTHYSSSEDILKRFSTRTSEKILYKEPLHVEETKNEIVAINEMSNTAIQNPEEDKTEIKVSTHDKIIKELRDQLKQKNNIIANLQDENLLLKNESSKNSEQVKYLENRIKYLEHTLDAFMSNSEHKIEQTISNNNKLEIDKTDKNNYNTLQSSTKCKSVFSRDDKQMNESQNSNDVHSKHRFANENISSQDRITDLRKRPNSADSKLQNNSVLSNSYDDETYKNKHTSFKLYDSDSEPNNSYKLSTNFSIKNDDPTSVPSNYINLQRQKLERDRSMNLSEFKSRLDEFTKYAQKSAEQNSLRNSVSSLSQSSDYKSTQKYSTTSDKWNDLNTKNRFKSLTYCSRPPIDPCYKQRKANISESKMSNETMNYISSSQAMVDEDMVLKDRVKKLLEKHNYPINHQANSHDINNRYVKDNVEGHSDFTNFFSNKQYKNNDFNKPSDWLYSTSSKQYGASSSNKPSFINSNIPRLDLTLINNA